MLISMRKYGAVILFFLSLPVLMAQSNDPVALADEYYRQGDLEKAGVERSDSRIRDHMAELLPVAREQVMKEAE